MSINTEKFLEDARKLTEQRMAAAEKIAQTIAARVAAEEALKEAEAEERKAYREAERNGWTKTELNKLKPTKRRRTSPQKTNTAGANDKTQTPSESTAAVAPPSSEDTPVGSVSQSSVMGNV
jgi:dsDNA-specific endonuclease/ATPase MutS2